MSYQKHNWVTREVIRREHLQNIEDGIYNEQERGEEAENSLDLKISNEITRAQRKETELVSAINGLTSDLTDETNRATQRENTIETSLNAEIERAIAAENQLSELVSDNSDNIAAEAQRSQTVEANLTTSIANEIARATQAESNLHDYVDEKVSTAYKASGSVYFEDLPALAKNRVGHVYNIKDDFTTTADFLEGEGKSYKAGTNVVITQVEELAYTEVEPVGEENPSEEGWYELVNDTYVLSTDTEVDGNKTYYVRTDYALYYDVQAGFVDYSLFATQEEVNDISNVLGAKNLLKIETNNATSNNVRLTVNDDGSLTINGTASPSSAYFVIMNHDFGNYRFATDGNSNVNAQYILSGLAKDPYLYMAYDTANKRVALILLSGHTADNVTFYPMIRLKSIKSPVYTPYAKTNLELTQQQYTFVGVCESAGSEQYKKVTVDDGFKFEKGVRIAVKFSNSNTFNATSSAHVTLNVNNTRNVPIYFNQGFPTGVNTKAFGYANRFNYYICDGTYWIWDGCSVDDNATIANITVDELKTGTATNQRTVRADYLNQAITEMINEHGSSGHTIVDSNGTELTSRSKLKFINATVTDDATNDQTIVTPSGSQVTVDSALSSTSTNPVQNKVINNALKECVPQLNSSPTYSTLADLWTAADALMLRTSSKFCVIRCKISTNFGMGTGWFRLQISSQNNLGNGNYGVTGSIIQDDGTKLNYYSVTGGKTDTSDLTITKKITSDLDTTPTSGSSNLITSGAVYDYIDTMITQAISASY